MRTLVILGLVALAALLLLRWVPRTDDWVPLEQRSDPIARETEPLRSTSEATGREEANSPQERPEVVEASQWRLQGNVVDQATGAALLARVELNGVWITDSQQLRQGWVLSADRKPEWLLVQAPNYQERRMELAGAFESSSTLDLGTMELEAKSRSTLRVVNAEGIGLEGISVRYTLEAAWPRLGPPWDGGSWHSPEERSDSPTQQAQTGMDGVVTFATGLPVHATLLGPAQEPLQRFHLRSGEFREVVYSSAAAVVRFVDAQTLAPQVGLEVQVWQPETTDAQRTLQTTDEVGEIRLAESEGPVWLRALRNAHLESWTLASLPASQTDPTGAQVALDRVDAGEQIRVDVSHPPGGLRLLDAVTGEPIHDKLYEFACMPFLETDDPGEDKPWLRTPLDIHPDPPQAADMQSRIWQGRLSLPFEGRFDRQRQRCAAKDAHQFILWVQGYEPNATIDWAAVRSQSLTTVSLQPVTQCSLAVQFSDGSPYQGPVEVSEPATRRILFATRGLRAEQPIIGPLDRSRGDLTVEASGTLVVVPETDLQPDQVTVVTLPLHTASIVIEGIPRGYPHRLVAVTDWSPHIPSFSRSGEVKGEVENHHILSLLPGNYFVGPLSLAKARAPGPFRPTPDEPDNLARPALVTLAPGEVARIPWDPAWSIGNGAEGMVQVHGAAASPFLVPLYTKQMNEDGQFVFLSRGRTQRIPMDRNGWYRLDPAELPPTLLLICVPQTLPGNYGGWHSGRSLILDSLLPGESSEVTLGDLTIRWQGGPRPGHSFVLQRAPMRYPVVGPAAGMQVRWPSNVEGDELVVRGIPVSVHSIVFRKFTRDPDTNEPLRYERTVPVRWTGQTAEQTWSHEWLEQFPFVLLED